MPFDGQKRAKEYIPQDGDTLESIAERETTAGNEITASDIARFNWGTDNPEVIDEYLRDELGCYRRGENNHYKISTDITPQGQLFIPEKFSQSGFSINKTHVIRIKKKKAPPKQFESCADQWG